jgi:hypothetical protein
MCAPQLSFHLSREVGLTGGKTWGASDGEA